MEWPQVCAIWKWHIVCNSSIGPLSSILRFHFPRTLSGTCEWHLKVVSDWISCCSNWNEESYIKHTIAPLNNKRCHWKFNKVEEQSQCPTLGFSFQDFNHLCVFINSCRFIHISWLLFSVCFHFFSLLTSFFNIHNYTSDLPGLERNTVGATFEA